MKFYLASDLHLDFVCNPGKSPSKLYKFLDKYFTESGNLILAGDISHYPSQILQACKHLSKRYTIFIVLGNHEFYNISKNMKQKYKETYSKFNYIKEILEPLDNVHFLDGDVITINNIKIGGCTSWYDGSFFYSMNNMYSTNIDALWKMSSNDANRIPGIKSLYDIWKIEQLKIKKAIEQRPDIMITHVCPVLDGVAFSDKYKTDKTNAFYCFDGLNMIQEYKPKFWVHGHIHDTKSFDIDFTTILRNPLGYPGENKNFKVPYFEVQ